MKTTSFLYTALAALMFAASSCGTENNEPPKTPVASVEPPVKIEIEPDYQTKMTNDRSFALDLFKTAVDKSEGENIFISPYSVNAALNMLWNGAAGETDRELSVVLGNETYTKEQINNYSKTLTDALLGVDPTTDISIANSLWAHYTTPFKPAFVETNQEFYNAEVQNVDFEDAETFDIIDRWCLDNTSQKIDKITEGMTSYTRFALINAIYFKSTWKYEFDKSETREEEFTNADGTNAMVDMMNMESDLPYSDDADWKMLSLPYGNEAFSMVLLMPYENEPLAEKAATLTVDKYYSLLNSLDTRAVAVKLPKFKTENTYYLHETILPAMGITQVFDEYSADLSDMCYVKGVFVGSVVHKTYIDVYEEGTEAAGATAVSGMVTSANKESRFFANRPFIYSIVENSTGTILFMGMMNNFQTK